MAKCIYTRILTTDNLELQGLIFVPNDALKGIVLHLHGLAGNFYENRFLDYMANEYVNRGIAFATVNLRGHDYISDLIKVEDGKIKYVRIGGAYEILEDAEYDIESWIHSLKEKLGVKKIILQGHSTGAIKAIYYLYIKDKKGEESHIDGLILLSPSDDIGLQKRNLRDRFTEALNMAKRFIEEKKPEHLMPLDIFFDYPLSAKTYVNIFGENSFYRVLELTEPSSYAYAKRILSHIKVPTLIVYGDYHEAIIKEPEYYIARLKELLSNAPKVDSSIIHGAPHNYLGYEEKVAKIVADWVKENVI